jgi:hypothetical protein
MPLKVDATRNRLRGDRFTRKAEQQKSRRRARLRRGLCANCGRKREDTGKTLCRRCKARWWTKKQNEPEDALAGVPESWWGTVI